MNLEQIKIQMDENEMIFSKKSSQLNILITTIWVVLSCIIGYCAIRYQYSINIAISVIFILSMVSRLLYQKLFNNLEKNEYKITRELFSQITDKEELEELKKYCDYKMRN